MAKATSKPTKTNTTIAPPQSITSPKQVGPNKKALSQSIVPIQLLRLRQNTLSIRDAITECEWAYYPYRYKLQQCYIDTEKNGQVTACVERRKDLTLLRKFTFANRQGKVDQNTMDLFTNQIDGNIQPVVWFSSFISFSLDALFYGYTLIELGDAENNAFPYLAPIKRHNISPDRFQVTTFPYQPHGYKFLENPYVDWHVWVPTQNNIATSPCGYGLFYKIMIYEVFLRNLYGYNSDYVETFGQPYRVGKTTKTEETERAELAALLQQMGSNGWALIDPADEIAFIESASSGTGYKSYDNFETRLNAVIAKVILGHADAMSSIPGKIGNSDGEFSPAKQAQEDKQTKDGTFIENIINDVLLPKLRRLGFLIPDDIRFGFKNDSEVMQNANAIADIAGKFTLAGLQIDPVYVSKQTGIPVTLSATPMPLGATDKDDPTLTNSQKTTKKLKALYDSKHVH